MGTLLVILAVLFASLFIAIPLIEKFSTEKSDEELSKMSRYIVPLMAILLIAYGIKTFL